MKTPTTSGARSSRGVGRRIRSAVAAAAVAIAGAWVGNASAQTCEKPACPSGDTYRDGYCYSYSGFPTYAESRTRTACEAGWTLDAAKGTCSTRGNCCDEKPLCMAGERYGRSETYRGKPYGVCESGPGVGGTRSHTLRECQAGWDLIGASGTCRKRGCGIAISQAGPIVAPHPAEVVRRPDLTIKEWTVRPSLGGGKPSNEVRFGQKYQVCFTVANIGEARSGPFVVQGGGLGTASGPMVRQEDLAPGATREGCLDYSTTPAPGTYRLTVTADAPNSVHETYEDNNSKTETITVVR